MAGNRMFRTQLPQPRFFFAASLLGYRATWMKVTTRGGIYRAWYFTPGQWLSSPEFWIGHRNCF